LLGGWKGGVGPSFSEKKCYGGGRKDTHFLTKKENEINRLTWSHCAGEGTKDRSVSGSKTQRSKGEVSVGGNSAERGTGTGVKRGFRTPRTK